MMPESSAQQNHLRILCRAYFQIYFFNYMYLLDGLHFAPVRSLYRLRKMFRLIKCFFFWSHVNGSIFIEH